MVHFNILIYFSFYLCIITGLWNTFKLYILDVTGMCDICAFSCEVNEVDVSRMLLWLFVWFCLLFYFPTYISYNGNAFSLFFFWSLCFSGVSSSHFIHTSLYTLFAGHAKLMVSLLQDIQASDQRSTMLQLVEKMKTKQKEIGWFVLSCF